MPSTPLDRLPAPRVFLFTGIVFNILSAVIQSMPGTYFETLELRAARVPLENDNPRLFSTTIFLQVTGLILMLARNLRRH
jgi:hypothetical protein